MSDLMTAPRWIGGTGIPELAVRLGRGRDIRNRDVDPLGASHPVGMIARLGQLGPSLRERSQMLNEEHGERMCGAEHGHLPPELMSGGSSAAALARLADLDAAASHGGHVGPEVIALHDHEAEPSP